jgi:hypothetical protein
MKRNRAAIMYCLLITGTLLYNVLSKPHAFIKEGYWRATLTQANQQIPFNLEIRGTSAHNAKVFLLTGSQRRELTHFVQHQDTLVLTLEPYRVLVKALIGKHALVGEAVPLRSKSSTAEISFRAEHGSKHPEESTALEKLKGDGALASLSSNN